MCRGLHCPPSQAQQRISQIVNGSDCHSECLDSLLRGQTDRYGGDWSGPCGARLSQYVNVCGSKHYSVGWCGSECQSVKTRVV